ncbi:MarR family winged helix-turn-helix transcriptional regulator [Bacillus sp. Marseille-P3661]|uniref:MarR family winged helix-turn-helix transcriptional regulator n=1 Tax=Bacillus sp. Marseille-P3661 TaxID=1936234 RepID=UPI000C83002B|nr:MarR family transcriptional regulator [Bacillus sp. Marseille-P3661]
MHNKRNENIRSLYETFIALERKWANEWNHHNEVGLSRSHILILEILLAEGPKRPSSIAEQLQITTGGVTVLTNKLIKDQFIRKTQNNRDRRVFILEITELGESILKKARAQIEQQMDKMFGMLSDDEVQSLRDIFNKCLVGNSNKN